jgi:putative transposase
MALALPTSQPTPDARPRLALAAPVDPAESEQFDRRKLTASQREALDRKLSILANWKKFKFEPANGNKSITRLAAEYTAHLEFEGHEVSLRTIQLWECDFSEGGEAALVDGRLKNKSGGGGGGGGGDDDGPFAEFFDYVRRLYLTQRKTSMKFCHDHAMLKAAEMGWQAPESYKTTVRMLKQIPHRVITLKREGPRKYDAQHGPYIERDYSGLPCNEVWESDEHIFDVWVLAPDGRLVRPVLIPWFDVRSRYVVGFKICDRAGDSATIISTFVAAGKAHGFPEAIHVDNGKIYDSRAMQGVSKIERRRMKKENAWCAEQYRLASGITQRLDVETIHAIPFNAKAKTIERFFGTVEGRFCRQFDSYCGNCPQNRPEELKRRIDAGQVKTLAEFTADFTAWLEVDYHNRGHTGDAMDGKTPAQVYAENLKSKRVLPADKIDLLTRRQSPMLKVGRAGVMFEGLNYGMNDLACYWGKEVYLLIDDNDRSAVQAYEPNGRLICTTHSNERLPYNCKDTAALKSAQREKAKAKRLYTQFYQSPIRMTDSTVDVMHRQAAQKRAALPAPTPEPNLVMIQSPDNAPSTDDRTPEKSKANYKLFREVGEMLAEEQSHRNPYEIRRTDLLGNPIDSPSPDRSGRDGGASIVELMNCSNDRKRRALRAGDGDPDEVAEYARGDHYLCRDGSPATDGSTVEVA